MVYKSQEVAIAYQKKWAEENRDKINAAGKRWRDKNKEKRKIYRRKYYLKHQEFLKEYSNSHRDRQRSQLCKRASRANKRYPGRITIKDIDFIVNRDGWNCYWCKKKIEKLNDLTLEHLKPVNKVEYLTIACLVCNCARLHKAGGKRSRQIWLTKEEYDMFLNWAHINSIDPEKNIAGLPNAA